MDPVAHPRWQVPSTRYLPAVLPPLREQYHTLQGQQVTQWRAPDARPSTSAATVSWQQSCQLDRDQSSGPNPAVNPFMQLARLGRYAGALLPAA